MLLEAATLLNDGANRILDNESRRILSFLFSQAGISEREITVNDSSFYRQVLSRGSLGLGNSYVEGKWDSPCIDEVICRLLKLGVYQKLAPVYNLRRLTNNLVTNLQDQSHSKEVIEQHYDLPAEFYEQILDPYMQYTCGRFEGTVSLDQAQLIKMQNICKKLKLKPGQKVLDVGGGWGGLAKFMKDNYDVDPTVVTLSSEQARYIREKHGDSIGVEMCDYRKIPSKYANSFDAVTAIGVLEHVGTKNYDAFMNSMDHLMRPNARILIHTLYSPYETPQSNPWSDKHIFPNGELGPRQKIEEAMQSRFFPDPRHPEIDDITPHYPPTLHAWKNRLTAAKKSGSIKTSEKEYRKWIFYFMSYAGAIKAGHVRVGQFLYQKINETIV